MTAVDTPIFEDAHAASLDGRRFQFTAPIASAVEPGTFVTLRSETDAIHLGQDQSRAGMSDR